MKNEDRSVAEQLDRLRICRADDLYYPGRTGCLGKNTGARRRRSDGKIPQGGGMPTPRMIFPSAADEGAAATVRVPRFPAGNRRRRKIENYVFF